MNTELWLAILGIIVTTVLGLWAIAVAFRFSRSVMITYVLDQIIVLTDDITQNFQDLGITFRGTPVSANLVLLKGYFINTGRRDISPDMVEEKISINVPLEFEWVEAKVVNTSPSLRAEVNKRSNQIIDFETGLWKKKEFFKFEALAKVPVIEADTDNPPEERPSIRLRKALTFTHRIADSSQIEQKRIPKPSKISRTGFLPFPFGSDSFKFKCISACVFIGMGLSLIIACKLGFLSSKEIGYQIKNDGEVETVSVKVEDKELKLIGDSGYSQLLTWEEFNSNVDKKAVPVRKNQVLLLMPVGIAYIIMGVLVIISSGIRTWMDQQILSLVTVKEKSNKKGD